MNKFALFLVRGFCVFLLSSSGCFAQQKINKLLFNSTDNITGLHFNETDEAEVFYTGKKTSFTIGEGIAHVENDQGEIMFWVHSNGVYDRENQLMPGSEGIFAHPSSTEISICPFPDNNSRYYIFYNNELCSGLYYSVVDMSSRNGAGDIIQLNETVASGIDFAEGLEIIRVPCSRNYWLIANECGKGLRKFKIDQEGISGGDLFGLYTNDFGGRGELDYHQGKIGYAVTFKNEAFFVDFDPETGEDSNYHIVEFPSRNGTYGLEFSPDGNKAYVTDISNRDIFGNPQGSNLFAVDFTTREITSWSISNDHPDCPSQMEGLGHIELGKDGNLYIAQIGGCQIVVVEDPGSDDPAIRKININTVLSAGISDHIQTDFLDENLILDASIKIEGDAFICAGEEKVLYTEESTENRQLQWYRDGAPVPGENNGRIKVKEAGNYELSISNDAECSAISNAIKITDREIPPLEFQEKYIGCQEEIVVLSIGVEAYHVHWSNGATGPSVAVQESGVYDFTVDNGYCSTSGSIEVLLLEKSALKVPDVITPNGDTYNDYFRISGAVEAIDLSVYNRWGKLVFYADDYQNNWKGGDLPKGTYYYKIQPQSSCSEQKKGWLMIL